MTTGTQFHVGAWMVVSHVFETFSSNNPNTNIYMFLKDQQESMKSA